MALSFLNAGTVFKTAALGSASTFTANVPTSPAPASGDLLLAIGVDWAGSSVTWTTPGGWNLVINKNDGATQDIGLHVYSKIATGTDTNQNFSLSAAESGLMVMVAYTGQDGTTPVDVSGGTATDTTTSLITPVVTTTTAGDILLLIYGVGSDVTTPTALSTPTSTTQRVAFNTINGTGGSNQALKVCDITQAAAGSSAQYTSTLTGASGTYGTVAVVIAVKAVAAGGTTQYFPFMSLLGVG